MFNDEFFPTPIGIVKRMIYPYVETYGRHKEKRIKKLTILEPSAGKGDLLDGITKRSVPAEYDRDENGNRVKLEEYQQTKFDDYDLDNCIVHCIEKELELQHILRGKGYKVVGEDFLNFYTDYEYDLILMNPPFSNGDEHLLHAWETIHNGDIVCLLNSETLNNPHTQRRQLLKRIIEEHGKVEELGPAFAKSERSTNVNVSLVRLYKKETKENKFNFKFESINNEQSFKIDEDNINDSPALKDTIGNMLIQYEKVKSEFIAFMRLHEALRYYGNPLMARSYDGIQPATDIVGLALTALKANTKQQQYNSFCDSMKSEMWKTVFQNLRSISSFNLESIMTSSVRQDWDTFVKDQGNMDFTKENVWSVIEMLFINRHTILEKCIVEAFDLLTKHHKENRMIQEGWKTNDSWKVNKRFILPHGVRYGEYSSSHDLKMYGSEFGLHYSRNQSYSDIDKALAYISNYSNYTSIGDALERKFKSMGRIKTGDKFDNTCISTFFTIKFWKKGTVHCEFRDLKLWEEFNMRACADKNWLPPEEKKKWQEKNKTENKQETTETKQLLLL